MKRDRPVGASSIKERSEKSRARVIFHLALWLGVFALWLLATRQFHPTWTVALSATFVLVAASALAVYINGLWLLSRFVGRLWWWRYLVWLTVTVALLDLLAVVSIQALYDWLWGPDPLRFGFWFNMASDGFIILLHVVISMCVIYAVRRARRKRETAAAELKLPLQ